MNETVKKYKHITC